MRRAKRPKLGRVSTQGPPQRRVRRIVSLLIDTGPAGDGSWRLSILTVLALVGPGSVPFAVLTFLTQSRLLRDDYPVRPGPAIVFALVPAAAVVLARFRPLTAWVLLLAGFAVTGAQTHIPAGSEPWPWLVPELFALVIVQFAVARRHELWVPLLTWTAALLVTATLTTTGPPETRSWQNLLLVALLSAFALVLGRAVRAAERSRERLAEEERLTSEERARRGLLEERARIARELHDVVAHHMSVIAVQASTAEYRLTDVPADALAEFESIGAQARESLTELRRVLTVLRSEDEDVPRAPQPGAERIDSVVESARRAGTPVQLIRTGNTDALPEPVSLAAYRIVQEALSNVVKHARGAATRVTIDGGANVLTVKVDNDAPDCGADVDGAGLGLAGMRERVLLLGGTLSAEPTAAGGFALRACLPIGAADLREGVTR